MTLKRCPHTSDGRLPRDEMADCEFCEGTAYCLGEIDTCPPELEPAERFPVLNQQNCRQRDRKPMPRSVPWAFVEAFRDQAEENHGQTLERLAERGGLAPEEMWMAAHGRRLRLADMIDQQTAIDWLYEASGEPR
jgi:hypothetical protein